MPVLKTCDHIIPYLALGHAIGRIGCFFAGCCYGKPTDLPWAVTFTHPHSLAKLGVPLHPTQLYSSIKALLVFLILITFRRYKKGEGQLIFLYMLLYAAGRLIIEPLRGDDRGLLILGSITLTQAVALILIPVAIFMLFYLGREHTPS